MTSSSRIRAVASPPHCVSMHFLYRWQGVITLIDSSMYSWAASKNSCLEYPNHIRLHHSSSRSERPHNRENTHPDRCSQSANLHAADRTWPLASEVPISADVRTSCARRGWLALRRQRRHEKKQNIEKLEPSVNISDAACQVKADHRRMRRTNWTMLICLICSESNWRFPEPDTTCLTLWLKLLPGLISLTKSRDATQRTSANLTCSCKECLGRFCCSLVWMTNEKLTLQTELNEAVTSLGKWTTETCYICWDQWLLCFIFAFLEGHTVGKKKGTSDKEVETKTQRF